MQWRQVEIKYQKIIGRENSSICIVKDNIYLFGGAIDDICFNQLFRYNINNQQWQDVKTTGEAPSPRQYSIMKYCPSSNAIYLYGGSQLIDIYVLDLGTNHWSFQTILPLVLSDFYRSNQMHLKFPYLYFPTNQQSVTNGVFQYSLILKKWKFFPFERKLYHLINSTVIIGDYLYICGKKKLSSCSQPIWKCMLTANNGFLKLYHFNDLNDILDFQCTKMINLPEYNNDIIYLFTEKKQMAAIHQKSRTSLTFYFDGKILTYKEYNTCTFGSCIINLKQDYCQSKFVYMNLYSEPCIPKTSFFPIPPRFSPDIFISINNTVFYASRKLLAKNSKLFSMLLSHNPKEIEFTILEVSSNSIIKMMNFLMEQYFPQKISIMAKEARYQYFMEVAYLAQYFLAKQLTLETDYKLCSYFSEINDTVTKQAIWLSEQLQLTHFAQLNSAKLVKKCIYKQKIERLLSPQKSKILARAVEQNKFDLIHQYQGKSYLYLQ